VNIVSIRTLQGVELHETGVDGVPSLPLASMHQLECGPKSPGTRLLRIQFALRHAVCFRMGLITRRLREAQRRRQRDSLLVPGPQATTTKRLPHTARQLSIEHEFYGYSGSSGDPFAVGHRDNQRLSQHHSSKLLCW
jgi:hypothetical protein